MKYIFFIFILILFSCRGKINQYEKTSSKTVVKTGKWIVEDDYLGETYRSIGHYRKGVKIGHWRTYLNGRILQKDCYKDSMTFTKIYHTNGKLAQKGQSKTIVGYQSIFWFYEGKWSYYDTAGQLDYIKIFHPNKGSDSINCKMNKRKCLISR